MKDTLYKKNIICLDLYIMYAHTQSQSYFKVAFYLGCKKYQLKTHIKTDRPRPKVYYTLSNSTRSAWCGYCYRAIDYIYVYIKVSQGYRMCNRLKQIICTPHLHSGLRMRSDAVYMYIANVIKSQVVQVDFGRSYVFLFGCYIPNIDANTRLYKSKYIRIRHWMQRALQPRHNSLSQVLRGIICACFRYTTIYTQMYPQTCKLDLNHLNAI